MFGNAGLDEAQTGIRIAGRNMNNFRYADDIPLMAESEEELKSLLMKVKEESEKVGFKTQHSQRTQQTQRRSWHPVPSLHGKEMGKLTNFYFLVVKFLFSCSQNHYRW